MAIKIWDATEGKVRSFLYEDGKIKKVLYTRELIEIGDIDTVNEIDSAMKIFIKYIIRISDLDKVDNERNISDNPHQEIVELVDKTIIDSGDLDKAETGIDHDIIETGVNQKIIETGSHEIIETGSHEIIETGSHEIIENGVHHEINAVNQKIGDNEIHEEADHKMNLLHETGKNHVKGGVQYLIDVNTRKNNGSTIVGSGSTSTEQNSGNIDERVRIISKDDIIDIGSKKKPKFHVYEDALKPHIQEILDKINKSNKGITVKISDIAEDLGTQFKDKSDVSIYMAVRHVLFKYGIKVEQCTLKEIDPATQHGKKGLKMRIATDDDRIPSTFKRPQLFE